MNHKGVRMAKRISNAKTLKDLTRWTTRNSPSDAKDKVKAALSGFPVTINQIVERTGLSNNTVRQTIFKLPLTKRTTTKPRKYWYD